MEHIRYSAAACQTDFPNPLDRRSMRANTERMLSMIDSAVAGAAPFLPVRLVVFPEFAHAAPVFVTVAELLDKLAIPIPNDTGLVGLSLRFLGCTAQGENVEWPHVVFLLCCGWCARARNGLVRWWPVLLLPLVRTRATS